MSIRARFHLAYPAFTLEVDVDSGLPVAPDRQYAFLIERGPVAKVPTGTQRASAGDAAPNEVPSQRAPSVLRQSSQ